MRGRFCTQPFLVERSACRPNAFLLPLRWVSRSPPHPPQCAHWGTFPPRGRLWGWVLSFRVSTVPPIYPAGHASQSFPARRRGKKIQSCFDRLRRPKHTSHPESAWPCQARFGVPSPKFGMGNGPGRQPDTPAPPACPAKNSPSGPIPNFLLYRNCPVLGRTASRFCSFLS